jgi:hypothetical protein
MGVSESEASGFIFADFGSRAAIQESFQKQREVTQLANRRLQMAY